MCIEFWKWCIYCILLPCGFFFFVNFATWNFVWSVLYVLRFEIICTVNWLSIKEEITSSLHRVHQHSHSCGLHTLLFFLYTTPLSDIIASHFVHHQLFADDTQLRKSTPTNDVQSLSLDLQLCTDDIRSWMWLCSNQLKLNGQNWSHSLLDTFSAFWLLTVISHCWYSPNCIRRQS